MTRVCLLLSIAFIIIFITPEYAKAHIDISPQKGEPNKWSVYSINVPTEVESPTTKVEVVIPAGYEVEAIGSKEKWSFSTERDTAGFVRKIKWSGGNIPPLTFEEFKFIAKTPAKTGSFLWTAYQDYEDGERSNWNFQTLVKEGGDSKESASAKEALSKAKVATIASFVAIGVTVSLIIVMVIAILQTSRREYE